MKFDYKESGPNKWDIAPEFDLELLDAVGKYTTLKVKKEVKYVSFEETDKIFQCPFIFICGEGTISFSKTEINNMREYCTKGGFIFVDECVYEADGDLLFQSFKTLVEQEIFPGEKMGLLPVDHPIYHCLFDFKEGLPFIQGKKHGGYGLSNSSGRLMIFLSPSDIHCGWSSSLIRENSKIWTKEKRELALKMGTNIVVYALTH